MPNANLEDVSFYYEESGQGEPVLLVPPSWWPAATWNVGVVPSLSQRFRTIIFDCRGTGRSSKPKDGYTVSQFGQGLRQAFGKSESFSLSRGRLRIGRANRARLWPLNALISWRL